MRDSNCLCPALDKTHPHLTRPTTNRQGARLQQHIGYFEYGTSICRQSGGSSTTTATTKQGTRPPALPPPPPFFERGGIGFVWKDARAAPDTSCRLPAPLQLERECIHEEQQQQQYKHQCRSRLGPVRSGLLIGWPPWLMILLMCSLHTNNPQEKEAAARKWRRRGGGRGAAGDHGRQAQGQEEG